jgi:hypothetical protein
VTPSHAQLDWAIAIMNEKEPPTTAELQAHLDDAFLAKVSAEQVQAILLQISTSGPYSLVRIEEDAPDKLVAVIHSDGMGYLRLHVSTDAQAKVQGLNVTPAPDLEPGLASWDEVDKHLTAIAPTASFLAADVSDGKCTPIHELHGDAPVALGSEFKLYVLSALARDVAAGKRAWTDPVAIEDAKKSLPSGETQNLPAGTKMTLEALAGKMISISDNTAADHLLWLAGRQNVEAAVVAAGGANAAANLPFLTTREIFAIKIALSPDEQNAYVAADAKKRRALLDGYDKIDLKTLYAKAGDWKAPRLIDKVEWFASPEDLCKLAMQLKAAAETPANAAVARIMAINPGIPDGTGLWKYIGFKGGSEPGVITLTWLLQRASDGKWFFVSVGWNDPKNPIDENAAIRAAGAARTFVGTLK